MLGRLDDLGVEVGRDGKAVGPADPCLPQDVDRARDRGRVAVHVGVEPDPGVTTGLGHSGDAGGSIAVEHSLILGQREATRRVVEGGEIDVARASLDVVELTARQREVGAHLDERQDDSLRRAQLGRQSRDRVCTPEVRRRVVPTQRPFEKSTSFRAARCASSRGFTSSSMASQAAAVIGARCWSRWSVIAHPAGCRCRGPANWAQAPPLLHCPRPR